MLLAELGKVKKYFGDRLILDIDNLKIYERDRIGVVGVNGSGKSTLLNILIGKIAPEQGFVKVNCDYSYISQMEEDTLDDFSDSSLGKFAVKQKDIRVLSGGERMRLKIAKGLNEANKFLIADEPTSNLDREGIELLQQELLKYQGSLLLVSHDREFMDEVCNTILEIEKGHVKLYKGNYSKYKELKKLEKERVEFEYNQYTKEKKRLEKAIEDKMKASKAVRKAPSRMGNSEARLHKMGDQRARASLDKSVNNIKSRIERLESKERPDNTTKIAMDICNSSKLYCKVAITGRKVSKSYGEKVIFNNAQFDIYNNSKTAIMGANGSGKTTLINMIMNGDTSINISVGIKIGYFSQQLEILDVHKTLIENVMKDSIHSEVFVRNLLSRMLLSKLDVNKPVSVLSGGERVKAALAKIMVSDFNLLVLDEPTNYLDIYSLEAIEEALMNYKNTVIFVSHDIRFVKKVADHIIMLENNKLLCFDGSYEEYASNKQNEDKRDEKMEKMILQNRLSEVIGRLSMPSQKDDIEELDREYKSILKQLKNIGM